MTEEFMDPLKAIGVDERHTPAGRGVVRHYVVYILIYLSINIGMQYIKQRGVCYVRFNGFCGAGRYNTNYRV